MATFKFRVLSHNLSNCVQLVTASLMTCFLTQRSTLSGLPIFPGKWPFQLTCFSCPNGICLTSLSACPDFKLKSLYNVRLSSNVLVYRLLILWRQLQKFFSCFSKRICLQFGIFLHLKERVPLLSGCNKFSNSGSVLYLLPLRWVASRKFSSSNGLR